VPPTAAPISLSPPTDLNDFDSLEAEMSRLLGRDPSKKD
jgi:hypothetical protein